MSHSQRRNISKDGGETRNLRVSVITIGSASQTTYTVRPKSKIPTDTFRSRIDTDQDPLHSIDLPMRRIRDKGENETLENVTQAFCNYSDNKHKRRTIKNFEAKLDIHLKNIAGQIGDESWTPSPYTPKEIFDRKPRKLAKAPVYDHVLEAASILPYEQQMYDYIAWQSPAVRPNMGTHRLMRHIRNDFYRNSQTEMMYYIDMDAHHYFPNMDHDILKKHIDAKVKPGKFRRFLYKVVDSYLQGAPLGIKVAQLFGQLNLSDFDRLALRFFDIGKEPEKLAYWTNRYVSDKLVTCRTAQEAGLLSKGVQFLVERFHGFVNEGVKHYHRFVDNIIFAHQDKTVLHILKELTILTLSRDYHITVNGNYNVRPSWMGLRIVGYQFFHEKTLLGKKNKKQLAKKVVHLRKIGLSEEEIRVNQASRFGYAKHVNSTHLIKQLGMQKSLGKIIKKHRTKAPFDGMTVDQKVKFSTICRTIDEETQGESWNKRILLIDFTIEDSKIEKERTIVKVPDSNGVMVEVQQEEAGKVMAIRFKKILHSFEYTNEQGELTEGYQCEKVRDSEGKETNIDREFYAFTGSKIMIDQAQNDFSKDDLPCPTTVQQFASNKGQKFFKFT